MRAEEVPLLDPGMDQYPGSGLVLPFIVLHYSTRSRYCQGMFIRTLDKVEVCLRSHHKSPYTAD